MTIKYPAGETLNFDPVYLLILMGAGILGREVFDLVPSSSAYCYREYLEYIQAAIDKYNEIRRVDLRSGVEALTHREFQVLIWLAEGCSNREIADIVQVTEATVKCHVERICQKLGAKNRVGAVSIAFRLGIVA